MTKKVPIYFDTIILDSPIQEVSYKNDSLGNGNRLKVAVFTKYRNRNGSYITDEFADALIKSAIGGDTPVVGFFDPEKQEWASHTGPLLANGYGYVEDFLGWEPLQDSDGETREYAVFSVVLFTKYYEEARKIRGQHQSMELNPETIEGDWASFDGMEYFVYTKGEMLGLCVIGQHEPCFSVSSFFSKNDDTYISQYEKFSSLLFGLKAQVEEAEKITKGGEQPMDTLENQEVVAPEVENPQAEVAEEFAAEEVVEEQHEEEVVEEVAETTEEVVEETPAEAEAEEVPAEEPVAEEQPAEPSEFELLQQRFNDLERAYNELQEQFNAANSTIAELNAQIETRVSEYAALENTNKELNATIAQYESDRKQGLIEKYEKLMGEEEIGSIREVANDFSYDALESKLAIAFANKQMTGSEVKKVPLPETETKSQFALLMEKYRKH